MKKIPEESTAYQSCTLSRIPMHMEKHATIIISRIAGKSYTIFCCSSIPPSSFITRQVFPLLARSTSMPSIIRSTGPETDHLVRVKERKEKSSQKQDTRQHQCDACRNGSHPVDINRLSAIYASPSLSGSPMLHSDQQLPVLCPLWVLPCTVLSSFHGSCAHQVQ